MISLRRILLVLIVSCCSIALADDLADIEAKMNQYQQLFNAKDIDAILEHIYAPPIVIGLRDGGKVLFSDSEDVHTGLDQQYVRIEEAGWTGSTNQVLDVCLLTDGLAMAEVNYTRRKADGNPIEGGVLSTYYMLQKFSQGWRITSFFVRERDAGVNCSS